jgi:hypothetical protein
MSTPRHLSDDPTLQHLLRTTFSDAIKTKELSDITASDLRVRWVDAGWKGPGASKEGWRAGWKKTVSEEWSKMVVSLADRLQNCSERELIVCRPPPHLALLVYRTSTTLSNSRRRASPSRNLLPSTTAPLRVTST